MKKEFTRKKVRILKGVTPLSGGWGSAPNQLLFLAGGVDLLEIFLGVFLEILDAAFAAEPDKAGGFLTVLVFGGVEVIDRFAHAGLFQFFAGDDTVGERIGLLEFGDGRLIVGFGREARAGENSEGNEREEEFLEGVGHGGDGLGYKDEG